MARMRVKNGALHIGVHHRTEGGAIFSQRGEEGFHDLLAVFAGPGSAVQRESCFVQLDGFAIAQGDGGIREIGIGKNPEDTGRGRWP